MRSSIEIKIKHLTDTLYLNFCYKAKDVFKYYFKD